MRKIRDLSLSFDPVAFGNSLQLQFRRLARANIFHDTYKQFDSLIAGSDAPDGQMRPDHAAVFSDIALLHVIGVDLAVQNPPHLREIALEIIRVR